MECSTSLSTCNTQLQFTQTILEQEPTAQGYLKCMPPHIGGPVVWTDVRTNGHVTVTSLPKFLGLIGYQISLAMVLRWRAMRSGSAIKAQPNEKHRKTTLNHHCWGMFSIVREMLNDVATC